MCACCEEHSKEEVATLNVCLSCDHMTIVFIMHLVNAS